MVYSNPYLEKHFEIIGGLLSFFSVWLGGDDGFLKYLDSTGSLLSTELVFSIDLLVFDINILVFIILVIIVTVFVLLSNFIDKF